LSDAGAHLKATDAICRIGGASELGETGGRFGLRRSLERLRIGIGGGEEAHEQRQHESPDDLPGACQWIHGWEGRGWRKALVSDESPWYLNVALGARHFKFLLPHRKANVKPGPPPYPDAAVRLAPASASGAAIGCLRVVLILLVILLGFPVLLAAALVPGRPGGARAPVWVAVGLSRLFLWTTGIRVRADRLDALREAEGFVFFNHVSYIDILVLLSVRPLRFLATTGVRRLPVIGWMAQAAGTVFVHRGRDESRKAARDDMIRASQRSPTPIALAPEGGIGPGPGVLPFRHGAFEVASGARAPVLLVALDYEPRGRAAWLSGEGLLSAYWRLAARTTPVTAHLLALPPAAVPGGPPEAHARRAEQEIEAALSRLWRSRGAR
jgi:1-acyl-sn-glycerol-3-phosphate acyltransferase